MTTYGLARVSTPEQGLSFQLSELNASGCAQVFREVTCQGVSELTGEADETITGWHVLIVTRLDRLARSTRDLLNLIDEFAKKGVQFKSLKDTWQIRPRHMAPDALRS